MTGCGDEIVKYLFKEDHYNMKRKVISVIAASALAMTSFAALAASAGAEDGDTIYVGTREAMEKIVEDANNGETYKGKTIVMTADISMNAMVRDCIPKFEGTFDGNGHRLTDYPYTKGYDDKYYGLFGYVDGVIKNLGVSNVYEVYGFNGRYPVHAAGTYLGTIAGYLHGSMINCYADALPVKNQYSGDIEYYSTLVSEGTIGGLVGYWAGGGSIEDCWSSMHIVFQGDINSQDAVGGIVGYTPGDGNNIRRCYTTSVFEVDNTSKEYARGYKGIVGKQDTNTWLKDCYYRSEYATESGGHDDSGVAGLTAEEFGDESNLPGLFSNGNGAWYMGEKDPDFAGVYAPSLTKFKASTADKAEGQYSLIGDYTSDENENEAASLWRVSVSNNGNVIETLGVAVNDYSETTSSTVNISGPVKVVFGVVVTAKSSDVNTMTALVNGERAEMTRFTVED